MHRVCWLYVLMCRAEEITAARTPHQRSIRAAFRGSFQLRLAGLVAAACGRRRGGVYACDVRADVRAVCDLCPVH